MKFFPKKNLFRKEGFTLTEILVVVLVIAILAAVAYPIYTKSATKSRAVEAINLLKMVRNKQLVKFARDNQYITDVSGLGQLTSNKKQESISGQELKVNDYTVSLNAAKNCVTAAYDKGRTQFSFSSGYENTGLGCTGEICSSFGNIVGGAADVCNCNGLEACTNGFVRNLNTCSCECNLCLINGSCQAPTQTQVTSRSCGNGGTQTRSCTASCSGGTCGEWGPCTGQTCPASSKPALSETCGNCGSRSRTVTCDSNTGNWVSGAWGSCSGEGVCAVGATQSCGNGGTQTCTSSCAWPSTCNEPACPASCSDGFSRTSATTGNFATCCTCPSPKTVTTKSGGCDVTGNCQADKMVCGCPNTADYTKCTTTGGTWNDATCSCTCPTTGKNPFDSTTGCACPSGKSWLSWRFTSGPGAGPAGKQCICSNAIDYNASVGGSCSNNVSTSSDMEARCKGLFCQVDCGATCLFVSASAAVSIPTHKLLAQRTVAGTWNSTSCSCSCPSGATLSDGRCMMCEAPLIWNGSTCVQPTITCTGASTQSCGNCNKGTQTRTCDTTTGQWSDWTACTGGGTCAPGDTKMAMCGTNTGYQQGGTESFIYQNLTCTSSCTWPAVTPCNHCVESPNCGKVFGGGQVGACYCTNEAVVDPGVKDCSNSVSMPVDTGFCGNCNTGTRTRTVTCNTSTGTWETSQWGVCTGETGCTPGATQACGSGGTQTCSSSCTWGTCQDCSDYSYRISHKSACCPQISASEDDGTCYSKSWSSYGGQAIGYGGCWAPDSGTPSCMADSSKRYLCTEDTDQYIPCSSEGDVCACMLCGGSGGSAFINTVNYRCSISRNGW